MGCDGGTIPKRDELVRMKKKPEQVDKNYELNAKWFHCALSEAELRTPIVCCELGNLYNKEAVLEYLIDKSSVTTDIASHIRSLKDVKELKLTNNPAFEQKSMEHADSYLDFQASRFICPVVGIEMNGRYKFCFIWNCGCVFSERALKEVPSTVCNNCGKPFSSDDLVVINGNEEEVSAMRAKMEERRQKTKMEKKAKKTKMSVTATSTNGASSLNNSSNDASSKDGPEKPAKRAKTEHVPSSSSAVAIGGKVSGASSSKGKIPELSKNKTVAEDPKASKVFKSLFSSSHKDRPKHLQSNWVTYHSYHI
ncbi:replication termination factor 2-like [Montipora foliosa]|uniref:replication termination factor 2-like n=1 Tax=Montipora foliosa TaxID=591990 RepID=UPI0035F12FA0